MSVNPHLPADSRPAWRGDTFERSEPPRPSTRSSRITRILIGLAIALFLVLLFGQLYPGVITSPPVTLVNDTNREVWITGCREIGTLKPRHSEEIIPSSPCSVFSSGRTYIGCLDIPDEVILARGEAPLSTADPAIAQKECGSSDHYARLSKLDRAMK